MTDRLTVDVPLGKILGKTADALGKHLDLHTVGDLVYHFPRRYDERGEHTDMRALTVGEDVTLMAQVIRTSVRPMRQRKGQMLEITIGDGSGATLTCTFFNQAWRERELRQGRWGLFAGKVTEFRGKRQLNGPDYMLLAADGSVDAEAEIEEFAGALIPVYPAAAAVPTWTIARCVKTVLDVFEAPADPLPGTLRATHNLIGLDRALREIHRPTAQDDLAKAKRRLKWDEAFAVQVTLVQRRARAAASPAVARPRRADGLLAAFDATMPFELTRGQQDVGEEIAADLGRGHPMHRLLQGEVGSGKTLVAVRAMLQAVDAGGQAALLAPTEVLAAQHHRGIAGLLGPLGRAGELDGDARGTRIALVTGSLGAAAKRRALAEIADGSAGIVVGTHALLYEGVDFHDLGLVVVDEQHRFGVEQRDALRAKAGQPPHVLVMTATPIPRTVAMTVYGDLEVSTLSQLPRGRSPIASHLVPAAEKPAYLDRAWRRIREEVAAGHQAYVVCPRIGATTSDAEEEPPGDDESARRPPLAVTEVAPLLAEGPLAGLRIGVLHGKLPADEKDAVMRTFAAGDLDVLVATTVIEVGVDVPNATVMVIMDADRFGVSQLHQLRGRVGRGAAPGLCLLVTEAPEGSAARERLDAVASTTDGFKLAELDLEQRREGDVLGASQSGRRSHLRLLSLLRDAKLIGEARAAADDLIADDPALTKHPALAASVSALVDAERAEYLEKG
ncbi:ATP-dependent DNA helicase RecG [Spirilliplanes yamanashiensis]|uniref:ATP-dependent DNA helicase RecG n=1 Tax=Spirilliplanes yamanashiensis TaxID=42233 RepID=A0A8J3Y4W6_9ACTN|nr:ATP-dependent DNA helicase RecG [Spirilliplanes yamanashiensis]MDP9819747.1 ATP-dependent DNA helicase RecG [Spirilliplanes yamanashiensis]GIJ01433.1 ATP-dependent DNA helicase RecG [Spirilliplanes yamanashiensis]